MKNVLRIALAAGALALVGCGGRPLAPGKEAAAGALFQSSRGAMGAPGMLAQVMNSGVITSTEIKVNCARGGQVALKVNVDSSGSAAITYDIGYDNCSWDGRTQLHGTLHMTFDLNTSSSSLDLALHLSGHVDLSGEISDHLDVDVTETVTASDLSGSSPTASIQLNGTISDSSGTYTFADELVTIDASGFTKAPDPSAG